LADQQNASADVPAWALAAIVIGCIVLVALVVIAVLLFVLLRKRAAEKV